MAELALAQRRRDPCRDENACDVRRRDVVLASGVAWGLSEADAELVGATLEVSPLVLEVSPATARSIRQWLLGGW
ncbi:MAG: hypothetical protein ACYCST_17700 [Acidimicrobiales bacterium]